MGRSHSAHTGRCAVTLVEGGGHGRDGGGQGTRYLWTQCSFATAIAQHRLHGPFRLPPPAGDWNGRPRAYGQSHSGGVCVQGTPFRSVSSLQLRADRRAWGRPAVRQGPGSLSKTQGATAGAPCTALSPHVARPAGTPCLGDTASGRCWVRGGLSASFLRLGRQREVFVEAQPVVTCPPW